MQFEQSEYTVEEDDGSSEICIIVSFGTLGTDITVMISSDLSSGMFISSSYFKICP